MSKIPPPPEAADDPQRKPQHGNDEAVTNAVEHEPDPQARPIPDGEPKFIPGSPFKGGNR